MRSLFLTIALAFASLGAVAVAPQKSEAQPPSALPDVYVTPARPAYYFRSAGFSGIYDGRNVYSTTRVPYDYPPSYIHVQPKYYWGTTTNGFYWVEQSPTGYTRDDHHIPAYAMP